MAAPAGKPVRVSCHSSSPVRDEYAVTGSPAPTAARPPPTTPRLARRRSRVRRRAKRRRADARRGRPTIVRPRCCLTLTTVGELRRTGVSDQPKRDQDGAGPPEQPPGLPITWDRSSEG